MNPYDTTINPGDRVRTIGTNMGHGIGVVVSIKAGHKRGTGPTVEVEVEFHGAEWFYPYRATFMQNELEVVGHG